jgi:hypothetical protein
VQRAAGRQYSAQQAGSTARSRQAVQRAAGRQYSAMTGRPAASTGLPDMPTLDSGRCILEGVSIVGGLTGTKSSG